jgi:5-methylcytosine-specific restriction protein A
MTHPCPGCLRVTSRPGRCVACGGGTTTQRGYGADWRRRRAQQLRGHPACQWRRGGDSKPCGQPATDVDHVVPKVHGGSDEAVNLQSLCARHHRRKTASQDRRWGTHVIDAVPR